jgi:transposase
MKDNVNYVGMDVHKATTIIVVLNAAGKQVMQQVVETKANTLICAIKAIAGTLHLTFEEGTHAAWLYDLLLPHVAKLLVCNAKHLPPHPSGNKSDFLDALRLANTLRLGSLKSVYHGQHGLATLKELVRSYQALVADCTRTKNRIKAIFRSRAIACNGESVYHPKNRQHFLALLSQEGARTRAQLLFTQLDYLTSLRKEAESAMIAEARKQPAFRCLDSIPTLGPVRVSLLLATMVTPYRFRTKRQLWSYSGFALRTSSSADFQVSNGVIKKAPQQAATRGLNDNHNPILKQVFKAAANSVRTGPLKLYFDRLCAQGIRVEMARLSLARKIAAITLAVWQKGVMFDPAFLQSQRD